MSSKNSTEYLFHLMPCQIRKILMVYKILMACQIRMISPLIKGGLGLSKNWVIEGGEGGCLPLFYYFTVQSHYFTLLEKQSFLYFFSSSIFCVSHARILIQIFICLNSNFALFKLVWNTRKTTWTTELFLSTKAIYFLIFS